MNNFSECKEIVPGLILGSVNDVEQMVEMGADVLVPLAYLESSVWNTDFRGEILYCPIKDRGVLPFDVLRTIVLKILIRLDQKKKVALFTEGPGMLQDVSLLNWKSKTLSATFAKNTHPMR